jgi:hypothetical protein
MKHASPKCLSKLNGLLSEVRVIQGLIEKKPGIFYLKGKAFLHFHEDPAGIFADARIDGKEFSRLPVNSEDERQDLLNTLRKALKS